VTPETVGGVRLELTPTDRIRSPSDVVHLLGGLVVVALGIALALWARGTLGGAEADIAAGLSRLTSRWERVILGITQAMVATGAAAIVVYLLLTRGRRRLLAWLALTVGLASGLTFALDWWLASRRIQELTQLLPRRDWLFADPAFPSSGLIAAATAGLVFGSPWMTRRWRQTGWASVGLLVLLRVGIAAGPSVDLVAAMGIGVVVGAAVLLARGAPSLEPSAAQLVDALRSAGLDPTLVTQLAPGHTTVTYRVHQRDRPTVRLGLRTQHDRSADVLTHMWQTVRLRADEVQQPFNTIAHRVEHEALALTLAARAGARVPEVQALVGTADGGIGIAETDLGDSTLGDGTPGGTPRERTPGDHSPDGADGPPDRAMLADVWEQVGRLHGAAIAHGRLSLRRVLVDDDGRPWLTGFERATLVADERERAQDVAQLLTDTALAVGAPTATEAAIDALGPDAVAAALPLLQPLALPSSTRGRLRGHGGLLGELREEVQDRTGVQGAPLERIERLRPRTLVTILALTLAFYLVLPQLADLRSTANAFARANWWWVPAIIAGSVLTYVFAAVSFIGAVPSRVRYWPALRARVASSFVGIIAPANSGTIALGVRFLQRSGVDAAPAAAAVGLSTAAGFLVHLTLTLVFVLWNGSSDVGSFSLPSASLVLGAVAVVLAAIGIALLFRGVRDRVLGPTLEAVRAALHTIGAVLTNPVRVAELMGGSVGTTLAYVVTMVAAVQAFGGGPTFTQVAVGYLVAAAFASVAPTPGGLGAFEAAMITALTGFGMGSGAAVSATLSFRLATYWLPVVPGWFCFTWMQRREEI